MEYSIIPPGRSISAAFRIRSFCISESSADFSGVQSRARASSFRNMPSPEHGASRRILLKKAGKRCASLAGLSSVTSMFLMPKSSRFLRRALALEVLISLASRKPVSFKAAPSAVAFPPGAAQRSRTKSPGSTGSLDAGVMALGSWR